MGQEATPIEIGDAGHYAAASATAPLVEYHRGDDAPPITPATPPVMPADNPLRDQAPAVMAPTAIEAPPGQPSTPPAVPAASPPRYATPLGDPVRKDVELQAALYEEKQKADGRATPDNALAPSARSIGDAEGAARRLAPLSSLEAPVGASARTSRVSKLLPQAFSKFKSLSTAGGGLAIVLALFLVCMWLLRGSGAKTSSSLPAEAFAVLGRAPLTAQSYAQLLRLGNKLVLVAVAADGAQPLAEVTDPEEVDRIAGLCAKTAPHGPSAEFQQVLAQLSREPARGFLGREGSTACRRAA
jgi:flagellar biogenesis protein FliO